MQKVKQDIEKGQLKQVYLLCGAEVYLIHQYRDKLSKAIIPEEGSMNRNRFCGKESDIGEIIGVAETLPFFSDRRLLLIEDTGFFKQGGDELAEYIKKIPETTYFVFAETEIDKRSRLYKAVSSVGYVADMQIQSDEMLKKWITGMAVKEGKSISGWAVQAILDKAGPDMVAIRNEMEKLLCYTYQKNSITEQDVDAIICERIGNHIFDMITAVATGRQKEALRLYYELLALREPPLRILFLLSKQLNQLMMVRELKQNGCDKNKINEKTGIQPFLIDRFIKQAANFKPGQIKTGVTECVDTEEDIKSGRVTDRMGIELLLVKLSLR